VASAMLWSRLPLTYGHTRARVILLCTRAIGAWVRHFFNLRHQGRDAWWILVSAAIALVALAIWLRPSTSPAAAAGPAPTFGQVQSVIAQRCAPCHSLHPTMPGVSAPPAGIVLD